MDRCDVLVVGGGPAGSSCAFDLVRAGLQVTLIDRARFPRPKVCAGWITPQVLGALGVDPEAYGRTRVLQPIRAFRTAILGRPLLETRYERVVSYGVLRSEFDQFLLARSGASLRLGEALTRLERQDGEWVANGVLRTPMVVGAGGHFCPVARRLGVSRPGAVVAAQEAEWDLGGAPCGVEGTAPELHFWPDLRGYGWCFRKGDHLNVGLGREGGGALPAQMQRFVKHLVEQGRIPAAPPDRLRGHAYRLWGRGTELLPGDGVLLVGDAAGLAYPQSGEGIRPAVESGRLAARVVVEAGGDYRRDVLAPYETRLARRLGPPPRETRPLPEGLRRWVAARLLASPLLTRRVVLDRWFLRASDAPLGAT